MAVSYADKFTVTELRSERYSDFYNNFNKNYGTKDIARITNDNAVINSIKNIVFTNKGERLYNPDFGTNVYKLLFENFSKFTSDTLRTDIITAIENYEPRAKINNVYVEQDIDNHGIVITLSFNTINSSDPITTSFLLRRIR
jgi:phage baseplate assembly protein W